MMQDMSREQLLCDLIDLRKDYVCLKLQGHMLKKD